MRNSDQATTNSSSTDFDTLTLALRRESQQRRPCSSSDSLATNSFSTENAANAGSDSRAQNSRTNTSKRKEPSSKPSPCRSVNRTRTWYGTSVRRLDFHCFTCAAGNCGCSVLFWNTILCTLVVSARDRSFVRLFSRSHHILGMSCILNCLDRARVEEYYHAESFLSRSYVSYADKFFRTGHPLTRLQSRLCNSMLFADTVRWLHYRKLSLGELENRSKLPMYINVRDCRWVTRSTEKYRSPLFPPWSSLFKILIRVLFLKVSCIARKIVGEKCSHSDS